MFSDDYYSYIFVGVVVVVVVVVVVLSFRLSVFLYIIDKLICISYIQMLCEKPAL